LRKKDVDGRDKPGHDDTQIIVVGNPSQRINSEPPDHLCKIAISGLMMGEAFQKRLIARSRAVARP
jgi:hypothetical protein